MANLLQLAANGLVFGSIILLASIGLSLLYGIADFANFAHGELLAVGAYLTFAAFGPLRGTAVSDVVLLGFPLAFIAAALVGTVGTGALGVALDRVLFKRHRRSPPIVALIVTIGVALVLRSAIRVVWGTDPRTYGLGLTRGIVLLDSTVTVAGFDLVIALRLTRNAILIVLLGAAFAAATHLFLTRTKTGVAMRATAANRSLARVTGIDTDRVITVTWALSGMLAGVGGVFLAVETGVLLPRMGFGILLVVFAAVILGGIGSPYGAMLGAYVIGLAQEMSIAIPGIQAAYRPAVAFLIMFAVLLWRPSGIMGES